MAGSLPLKIFLEHLFVQSFGAEGPNSRAKTNIVVYNGGKESNGYDNKQKYSPFINLTK